MKPKACVIRRSTPENRAASAGDVPLDPVGYTLKTDAR
jgi:hypothetical protein